MGRFTQKRLIRKLDLEMFLSLIEAHPCPKPNLEQYTVPVDVAATMLYVAAYTYDDIANKTVIDLGCGTGRLALAASFLGASHVTGVDLDKTAIKIALENSVKVGLKDRVQWVAADIDAICGGFDTVIQNPPFGVQKRGADRKFLKKALEIGAVVYSLHKNPAKNEQLVKKLRSSESKIMQVAPSRFIERFVEQHGGKIKAVYAMLMTIPHMFSFHEKRKHEFVVDLYVMEGGKEA